MKSLDYVQQSDGSFRWEMVELREAAQDAKPEPEKPVRRATKKVTSEPVFVESPIETPEF